MTKTLLPVSRQYDIDDMIKRENDTVIWEFEPTLTVQDSPDADLNVLMARMGVNDHSVLPATLGITDPRYYGDFTEQP